MIFTGKIWTALVCVAALVALAGLATVASAGKKLSQSTATASVGTLNNGSATAVCNKGKAVSGGFLSNTGTDASTDPVFLHGGSLRQGARAWNSSAINSAEPGQLTSFAYCRKQKVKSKQVEENVGPASGGNPTPADASVKCKKSQRALSGGFDNPGATVGGMTIRAFVPSESRKQGRRGWRVAGVSGGNASTNFVTQVNCGKRKLKTREGSTTLTPSAMVAESGEAVAKCKKSQRVVSGGFSGGRFDTSPSRIALIYGSHREGKRKWKVSAVAQGDFSPEITAYAYCEKKKKK